MIIVPGEQLKMTAAAAPTLLKKKNRREYTNTGSSFLSIYAGG